MLTNPENGERIFRSDGARPPAEVLKALIGQHRHPFGVEPTCKVLRIARRATGAILRNYGIRQRH